MYEVVHFSKYLGISQNEALDMIDSLGKSTCAFTAPFRHKTQAFRPY